MGLFDDGVKTLEQNRDAQGLVKRLVTAEGRRGGPSCLRIVDALERLGADAVPALASALDEGHPGVPAALTRIGSPALPALAKQLRSGNVDVQIGAALTALMIKASGDEIDGGTGVVRELERRRDTSHYLQVVAFSIAALRPPDASRLSGYYKQAAPQRKLMEYHRNRQESWQWADAAAYLAFPLALHLRHDVADNVMVAMRECDKAARAAVGAT
jgi:hypothetical protein